MTMTSFILSLWRSSRLASCIAGILLLAYAYLFWKSVRPYWFHPAWTTDDALQQVYPFLEVIHPGRFEGDLITDVMTGYLAPLHYWICYGLTMLTGDVIMMSHWVMLLQIMLTSLFVFLAVRTLTATAPALLAVIWFLHSRHIVQRMTAGLPRGWAAVVLTAGLYALLARRHKTMLGILFIGCLLHPPATALVALSYGASLTLGMVFSARRKELFRPFLTLLCFAPIYLATVVFVVQRPESVGQMVTLKEAAHMPEFQAPDGRFPFLPFPPPWDEIRGIGFQAFLSRFFRPDKIWQESPLTVIKDKYLPDWTWRDIIPWLVLGICALSLLLIILRGKWKQLQQQSPLLVYGCCILIMYFLSRALAFRLYVPDRHLQFPLCFFFIFFMTAMLWQAFRGAQEKKDSKSSSLASSWPAYLAFAALAGVVYFGSGSGLDGPANFNYSSTKRGWIFPWIKQHTPEKALFAGHPIFIDGLMLFAERRGYITNETAHPFYLGYLKEVNRRLEISFRAHYAETLDELVNILGPEGIDYFIFERAKFYPEALRNAQYHPPLDALVKQLTSRPVHAYAFRALPSEVNTTEFPFLVFKDNRSVLIDVQLLKKYREEIKQQETP